MIAERQNKIDEKDLLRQLYGALEICRSSSSYANDNAVTGGSDRFNTHRISNLFSDISNVVDRFGKIPQCYGCVDGDPIIYSRTDGTVYCRRKKKEEKYSYQDLYKREDLPANYRLHVFVAEMEMAAVGSNSSLVVSVTNQKGVPIHTERFDYWTDDSSLYHYLVCYISRGLKRELNDYLLSNRDLSAGELKMIIEDNVFSILTMKPKVLKEMESTYENKRRINKSA